MTCYTRSLILTSLAVTALCVFSVVAFTSSTPVLTSASADSAAPTVDDPQTFLNEAYSALRTKFSIGAPLDSIRLGDGEIKAFQHFSVSCSIPPTTTRPCAWCRNATVSMEVHQNGSDLSVWVSVPHHGLDACDAPAAYLWYEYVKDADQFSVVAHPLLDVPPFPAPDIPDDQLFHLYNTFSWSHMKSYGPGIHLSRVDPSADPPHWSSILNGLDEGARTRYLDLHRRMQNSSTQNEAIRMLFSTAPPEGVDLTDRAMDLWTPVTLRGLVRQAGVSGNDFARDHTTDYHDGRDAPHGSLLDGESTDTSWPGQDYDMRVIPDPDVHYLGSWVRGIPGPGEPGLFDLNVEIEHFALGPFNERPIPAAFRDWDHEARMNWLRLHPQPPREGVVAPPRAGEWAQILGRWIIDCGHGAFTWQMAAGSPAYSRLIPERLRTRPLTYGSGGLFDGISEHYTEIHPPELMVPVTYPTSYMAEARVIATGAWAGEPLTFFVTPPPRPNINAVLRSRIKKADGTDGYDTQVGGTLDLTPWPTTNPNHLVGTLRSTDGDPILLYETGMVGMTRQRRIHCTVECWWETPSASLSGRVTGGGDLSDTVIYYRNAGIPDAVWSRLTVNSSGAFSLVHLEPGSYWFRPASPNRDFTDVPRRVTVSEGRNVLEPFAAAERTLTLAEWGGLHSDAELPSEIFSELTYELLTLETDRPTLGVQRNELRYAQNGWLLVHLAGLVRSDRDSSAVASKREAFCDTTRGGGPGCLRIPEGTRRSVGGARYLTLGVPGSGVSGATFVVKLLLLINGRNYVTDEQTFRTGEEGTLNIGFHSGSHVEEVSIAIEATDNPFNRWFLPIGHTQDRTVYPGASGDDTGRQSYPMFDRLSPASLGLSRLIIPPGRLSPLPGNQQLGLKPTLVEGGLIEKINEKRIERNSIPLQAILSNIEKQKINPVSSRARMLKDPRLPKLLEDSWLRAKDPKFRGRLGGPLPKAKGENIKPGPKPGVIPKTDSKGPEIKGGKGEITKPEPKPGIARAKTDSKGPGIREGESLIKDAQASGGNVRVMNMAQYGDAWSHGQQLLWAGGKPGDRLVLKLNVSVPGRYQVAGYFAEGPDYGRFQLFLNGQRIGAAWDGFAAAVRRSDLVVLGEGELVRGINEIVIEIVSADKRAKGFSVGIDGFEFGPR